MFLILCFFVINALSYQLISNLKVSCGIVLTIPSYGIHLKRIVTSLTSVLLLQVVTRGVDPVHLSKGWSIDLKSAKRTIEVIIQLKQEDTNDGLSQNFSSTNDWI